MERLLVSVAEAAEALHVSRNKVYEMIYRGELGSVKIGSMRRVPVSALREFAAWKDPELAP